MKQKLINSKGYTMEEMEEKKRMKDAWVQLLSAAKLKQ